MGIENPAFLSKPKKGEASSKIRKTVAMLGSAAAVLMATTAYGEGKAVTNKVIIDEKERPRIGMTDDGIERPKKFSSAPEKTAVDLNQDTLPVEERIFTDDEEMAKEYIKDELIKKGIGKIVE